jgi:hypothetical protein
MAEALARAPVAPTPEPDDPFGQLTAAEKYALVHLRRAARIRWLGCSPDHCDFGAPVPDLVHAVEMEARIAALEQSRGAP